MYQYPVGGFIMGNVMPVIMVIAFSLACLIAGKAAWLMLRGDL